MKTNTTAFFWPFFLFILFNSSECSSGESLTDNSHVLRFKRETSSIHKTFVIPRGHKHLSSQLFTVAPSLRTEQGVTYQFANETPGLSINQNSGIVSNTSELSLDLTKINFEVQVLINDKANHSIFVTVKLISRNLDDPIFSNDPFPMWIVCPVWVRPGTVIYTVQSLDLSYGATDIIYTLESGGEGSFGVNPSSGEVYVIGRQQFELNKVYTLLISAQSKGMRLTGSSIGYSQSLNIKIGYRNPQFFRNPYNITFFENASANSIIGKVEAKSFQDLPLIFNMTPASDLFVLDGQSGSLTLTRQLTFALNLRQYFFNVTATEGFSKFFTTIPLTITLMSINHPPVFPAVYHTLYNITENFTVGDELLTMVVRDYDPGSMGTLTLATSIDTFRAELNSEGLISLKLNRSLDYESVVNGEYKFDVVAMDGGSPSLSSTATIQIWVKNENNKAPVLEPENQNITVREGAGPDLLLFFIQAYDPDGDDITFSYDEATNDRYFKVNSSTGAVTLTKPIIAGQNISSFNLLVNITDDGSCCGTGGHITKGSITVYVYRVNTQPTFPECRNYAPSVTEDQIITAPITILNMTAKDTDVSQNGELTFQIFGDEVTFFQVAQSGPRTVSLQLKSGVNRATRNLLMLNDSLKLPVSIMVQDKGIPVLSSYCLVFVTVNTINLYPPVFDYGQYSSYVYIPQLLSNQRLFRVFAYDRDFGVNGQVKYSINFTASNSSCTDLYIEDKTGWILWRGTNMEEKKFVCVVVATDGGTPSRSASVGVTFTFSNTIKSPTWGLLNGLQIDDTFITVPENESVNTAVANLSASIDNDLAINFFIAADNFVALNGDGNFAAQQTKTGSSASMNVVLKKDLADANLQPEYFLRCRAFVTTSEGTLVAHISRLKVIVKDVNNEAPKFLGRDSNGIYTAAVTQYSKKGDYVATVTAVDMDRDQPNNKVSYKFLEESDLFAINEATGEITVSSEKQSQIFDPDIKSRYDLTVVATDGAQSSKGPLPNTAHANVLVIVSGGTLGKPYFKDNFTASVNEGVPRHTNVLKATATIPSNQNGGTTSIARYNIHRGNSLRRFAVDPQTGSIYTVGSISYSMEKSYQLIYAVFDGLKNNFTNIVITINKRDIFPPTFNQSSYTYSGTPIVEKDPIYVGTRVATVLASSQSGNQVIYSSSSPDFSVNALGVVTISRPLSRDSPDGFAPQQVNIVANDGVNPPAYAVVTLNLTDINDHHPLFDLCCTIGTINENSNGSPVMKLKAWDADFGANGTVKYSIVDDPSRSFNVNSDGLVVVSKTLDFETKQKYSVKVKASDEGPQKLSSETIIDIYVNDVSEYPPIFALSHYPATIPEELPLSSVVIGVRAMDSDPMDRLVYSIQNKPASEDGSFFYVETLQAFNGSFEDSTAQRLSTAIIKISKRIDYDMNKKSSYIFDLIVKDSSGYQASTEISVQITDTNDNPPFFNESRKVASLSENTAPNTVVTSFSATDIDTGINGQFMYSIDYENSDPRFMFQINSSSGEVKVRSKLDYEWKKHMDVKILAIDKGSPPLTGTATLTVNVENADDSAPILLEKIPVDPLIVPTASEKGTSVYCLKVTDPDNSNTGFNYQLDCAGFNSEVCSDFTVSETGCLLTKKDGSDIGYRSYVVPITITKRTGSSNPTTEIIGVTVKNTSLGKPTSGEKNVKVMNYVGPNGGFSAMPLGNVYALDSESLQFDIDPASNQFYLDGTNGEIWLWGNVTSGEHTANIKVTNKNAPSETSYSKINVKLKHVNESALKASSSLRIIGLRDARDLLQPSGHGTILDSLATKLGELVGRNATVEILSIWTAFQNTSNSFRPVVDVLYAVHGSPYYSPAKLSALVWANRSDIFQKTKLNISMSPVDLCRSEFYNCWDLGCETKLKVNEGRPRLINTDGFSFVGLTAEFQQICSCPGRTSFSGPNISTCLSDTCLNGGTCMMNNSVISCLCPIGFDGPRCQKTNVSVRDGYVLLPPLTSCEVSHLSFEFQLSPDSPATSLLLYNGPISQPGTTSGTFENVMSLTYEPQDFLLLELVNGVPRLRIDFGDGEINLTFNTSALSSLNDRKWHSIDIIHEGKEVRMMVDKCGKANLTENITSSLMDTSQCEVKGATPLQRFLLNSMAPLQLGGRWDSSNEYPRGWSKSGFRGCFRNLKHNGEIYDLSLSSEKQYYNAKGCSNEDCSICPANATCLLNVVLGSPICHCPNGFRGSSCDIPTTVKYFEANGFAYWEPSKEFKNALNSTDHSFWFADRVDLSFRTRQKNGVLFMAQSFTGLERYLLEIKEGSMVLAFDLGSGDVTLTLPNVIVSDGGWHNLMVVRYGNMVEMHLDTGDGMRYNASLPSDGHRLLKIHGGAALGDVSFDIWRKELTTKSSLWKSCITDVRYGGYSWPLDPKENSEQKITAEVTLIGSSDTGCAVGSCSNDQCPANMTCVDIWQATQCICKNYLSPLDIRLDDSCVAKSCLTSPCLNGGTCVMVRNIVTCICPQEWSGNTCNTLGPKNDESSGRRNINLAAAIALPIIFGLLLLLLLALLIWWCCCRRMKDSLLYDEPDKDIRENVIDYDDEGAGEEDNYAFDLSQLQKLSPFEVDSFKNNTNLMGMPVFANRVGTGRALPGDYPSIADYIADRLNDIDNNPDTLLDDSRANFTFEGQGSLAGSLSSLASSDSDRDADFDWLENAGPQFGRLADLYGDTGHV